MLAGILPHGQQQDTTPTRKVGSCRPDFASTHSGKARRRCSPCTPSARSGGKSKRLHRSSCGYVPCRAGRVDGLRFWNESTYHPDLLMRPRLVRGPALVPLALLFSSAVAKAWTSQHPSDEIPERINKVIALEGGGALVLGYNSKYEGHDYQFSDVLVRIGPEGEVSTFAHPDAGLLRDLAVRGSEIWVLGTRAVLHRNGQTAWKRTPLPANVSCGDGKYSPTGLLDASDVRDSNVVGIGLARAAVTCTNSGDDPRTPHSTTALIVDAEQGIQTQYEFKHVAMGLLVPDGDGGFWTYVDSREVYYNTSDGYQRLIGAAWYSKAKWTLYPTGGPVPSNLDVRKNEAKFSRSNFAAEDGAGGYWLISDNGVRTHVQPAGVSVSTSPPFGRPGPAAFDHSTGDLLIAANDWHYRREGDFGELARLGHDGRLRKQDTVPMSSAARGLENRTDLQIESLSIGSGEVWLSSANFVLRWHEKTWTSYWSPSAIAGMTKESYAPKWALGALILATPGVFGGASINGEKYWATGAQTLSGSLLGAMPLLVSPSEMQALVAHGPIACVSGGIIGCLLFGGEGTLASVLAGLGTFAAGESMRGSRHTGAAIGGAMAGAFAGTLSAALLSLLVSEILPEWITVGLNLGLVGSGATIGYQWAGGGPRR